MTTRSFFDQLGNEVSFQYPPKRIVSLVPSQTELLADLGLEQQVIGITKFCLRPSTWLLTKTIIGGTKNFQFDSIDALNPDLVIGNKEENYIDGITRLKQKYPVWLSDIITLEDAYSMITSVGAMTNTDERAAVIKSDIKDAFNAIRKKSGQSVLYLIWRRPWMAAGNKTFIHSMLDTLNLRNVMQNVLRYPTLTAEEIRMLKADYIFLSSEPYPFGEKHLDELRSISPLSEILLVNGEMFSWYGSRLIKAPEYFNRLMLD